jgi:hypothetical protein
MQKKSCGFWPCGMSRILIGTRRVASLTVSLHRSQLSCLFSFFSSSMPLPRSLSFNNRSRSSGICGVCVTVVPRNSQRWDTTLDMCRLCAMNQAEQAAQQRARLVGAAEEEELRVQTGLTIRIPPRIHRICALCNADYIVLLSENPTMPSTRCPPCQKSERCSGCKKIKKRKHFRKDRNLDSLYKTCKHCREKATALVHKKRAQAESEGIYMHVLFALLST